MDELRKLANLANTVAGMVENIDSITTEEQFSELQGQINWLQYYAPKCEEATTARVIWYKHGLSNLERFLVEPVEQRVNGWEGLLKMYRTDYLMPNPPKPDWIMGWRTFEDFLRHKYLGKYFAEIYQQVERIIVRMVKATDGTEFNEYWQKILKRIRKDILEGRI